MTVVVDGCGQKHQIDNDYVEAKRIFETTFIDHLPITLPTVSSFSVSEDRIISHPGIWVKAEFSKNVMDSIQRELAVKAIAQYSSTDTCLMLIDKHLDRKNWLNFEKNQRRPPFVVLGYSKYTNGKLLIPKFWREGWSETETNPVNLGLNYDLYVLDAKSGLYWDTIKLPNGKFTPEGWEHGYSKGAAVNHKTSTIIFWFDIW